MTALSQAEDKDRAEKLGADRYLVKSQVTLEDVVRVTGEVLQGNTPAASPAQPNTMQIVETVPVAQPMPIVAEPLPAAVPIEQATQTQATATEQPIEAFPDPNPAITAEPTKIFVSDALPAADPAVTEPTQQPSSQETDNYAPVAGGPDHTNTKSSGDDSPVTHQRIIQPLHDLSQKPDISSLLAAADSSDNTVGVTTDSVISPTGEISASPDSAVDPNSVAL